MFCVCFCFVSHILIHQIKQREQNRRSKNNKFYISCCLFCNWAPLQQSRNETLQGNVTMILHYYFLRCFFLFRGLFWYHARLIYTKRFQDSFWHHDTPILYSSIFLVSGSVLGSWKAMIHQTSPRFLWWSRKPYPSWVWMDNTRPDGIYLRIIHNKCIDF